MYVCMHACKYVCICRCISVDICAGPGQVGERQTRGATGLSGIYARLGALEASVAALNTGMQEVLVHLRSGRGAVAGAVGEAGI